MAVNESAARRCARRRYHLWYTLIWKKTDGYNWSACEWCGIRAYYGNGNRGWVGFAFEDGRSVLEW